MNFIAKAPLDESSEDQISNVLQLARQLVRCTDHRSRNTKKDGVTPAMERLLVLLKEGGAQTVPELARALNTGRQHIQRMVNALADQDLLEREINPAHKRSWLISLSDAGEVHVRRSLSKGADAFAELAEGVSAVDLQACQDILQHLVDKLEKTPGSPAQQSSRKPRIKRDRTAKATNSGQGHSKATLPPAAQENMQDNLQEKKAPNPVVNPPVAAKPVVQTPAGGLNWNGGGGLRIG